MVSTYKESTIILILNSFENERKEFRGAVGKKKVDFDSLDSVQCRKKDFFALALSSLVPHSFVFVYFKRGKRESLGVATFKDTAKDVFS